MRAKAFLAVVVLGLSIGSGLCYADDGIWHATSPGYFMNRINSIDAGYTSVNEKIIYAGEDVADGKVWFSNDDGASWNDAQLIVSGHGICEVFTEKNDLQYVWALVRGNSYNDNFAGPFLYEYQTGQWSHRTNGLVNNMALYSMAVNYSNGMSRALVGGGDAANYGGGSLFLTINRGSQWTNVGALIPGMGNDGNQVVDIAFAPGDPQIAYFILDTFLGTEEYRGLYKSTDGGETWPYHWYVFEEEGNRWEYYPTALAVDPLNPNRVAVATLSGRETEPPYGASFLAKILVSTEDTQGNRDWSSIYDEPIEYSWCRDIEFSSSGSYMFLAFTSRHDEFSWPFPNEHFVIRLQGSNPVTIPITGEQPGDKRAWSIAIDPRNDDNIYIGTEHLFYRSNDNGNIVSPCVNEANLITTISKIDAKLPYIHFMTAYPPLGSIYRSSDYGQNWALWDDNWRFLTDYYIQFLTGNFIHSDPGEEGLIFAGSTTHLFNSIYSGILKSTDGGLEWSLPSGWPAQGIEGVIKCLTANTTADPTYGNHIYFGVSESTDRGLYWSASNGDGYQMFEHYTPPLSADPLDIAIHPSQPINLLIADGHNGLFRTMDHGANFNCIGFSGSFVNKIKICPGQPNMAIAATASGIYKSNDMNLETPSWSSVNPQSFSGRVEDLDFHPADNSIILFCANGMMSGNFFLSADSARSWFLLNYGISPNMLYDLDMDDSYPDTIYASTNNGIYKLKNPVKSGMLPTSPTTQTWGPGTVIINGDLTIPSGITLNIAPGTSIKVVYTFDKIQGGYDEKKSEITVFGTLNVNGTPGNPVIFESSDLISPRAGQWYGIRAEYGGHISMSYCEVRHADYGVYAYKPLFLNVNHCLFENNSNAGIYYLGREDATDPVISNSRIQNCGKYGIYCYERSLSIDTDTLINNYYGVRFTHDGLLKVTNCRMYFTVPATTYYGIWASKEYSGFHPIIEKDSIAGFAQGGIYFKGGLSPGHISGTTITNCGSYGIYYDATSDSISGGTSSRNHIEGNIYGLRLISGSNPIVRRTRFFKNKSYGVRIEMDAAGEFGNGNTGGEGYNSFIGSGTGYYDLFNDGPSFVSAQYNYWGEPIPLSGQIINADYSNYFSSDRLPYPRIAPPSLNLPNDLDLAQAYPNPFNPTVTIRFNLSSSQNVSIIIYNIMGQEVKELYNGIKPSGTSTLIWDGADTKGKPVSSGLYFCKISTEEHQQTVKITVLR